VVETLHRQLVHYPGAEQLSWKIPTSLPPLLADENALVSVLFHLVDNAIKYAPEGEIEISAGQVDDKVWISVSDHGPGIAQEAQPLLFERFYRFNASDAQAVYGHGLGLYIVRRLMDGMNGQVTAANQPEGGAVFTLTLPLGNLNPLDMAA
jgi:signal transduction histidine kinase